MAARKEALSNHQDYICIECEHPAAKLFSVYEKSGNIKVEKCTCCNKIIDKYIEYDVTICLLDLLLLNTAVWRHVLFNLNLNSLLWKLAIVCMICDGYRTWVEYTSNSKNIINDDTVFYAAKQIELYVFSIIAGSELIMFLSLVLLFVWVILLITKLFSNTRFHTIFSRTSFEYNLVKKVVCSLLVANCTKLLYIPALIWPHYNTDMFMYMLLFKYKKSALV